MAKNKEDKYWSYIDVVRMMGSDKFDRNMVKLKKKLGDDKYSEFQDWIYDKASKIQSKAEDTDGWGMSDDSTQYASYGAVLAGKEDYESCMKNPENLYDGYEDDGEEFSYSVDADEDMLDDDDIKEIEQEIEQEKKKEKSGDSDDDKDTKKKNKKEKPERDEDGNIVKHEEVKDPDTGKKVKVVTHTGPRGGKFYWPEGSPKDDKHKVYVQENISLVDYLEWANII